MGVRIVALGQIGKRVEDELLVHGDRIAEVGGGNEDVEPASRKRAAGAGEPSASVVIGERLGRDAACLELLEERGRIRRRKRREEHEIVAGAQSTPPRGPSTPRAF